MQIITPDFKLEKLFEEITSSPESVLFLDYDGTLAPFRIQRDKAVPYPGIRELLNGIIKKSKSRVVIISGRWTRDLIPLLNLDEKPEIWGSHGWERFYPDGRYEIAEMDEKALKGLADADKIIEDLKLTPWCEQKPGSLAIHWRGMNDKDIEILRERLLPLLNPIAFDSGLTVKEFDGGLELRVPGRDKGDAVNTILGEMNEGIPTAYLGDDLTDEDAFNALKGRGYSILVRKEYRPTAADLWLKPPGELMSFLDQWLKRTSKS
ncbi:MAG: trehalose-phosphatase [candidate division Zixibacteria bacterium]|nr:trehalose-phosphatase [candidate division Zixibacteria bacterium]